ncbi:hypothetical protein D3C71_2142330 [compost metagenome]
MSSATPRTGNTELLSIRKPLEERIDQRTQPGQPAQITVIAQPDIASRRSLNALNPLQTGV